MENNELHGLHIEETNLEHHEDNDLDMDAELGNEEPEHEASPFNDDDESDDADGPEFDDGQPDEYTEWQDFMGGDDPIDPYEPDFCD